MIPNLFQVIQRLRRAFLCKINYKRRPIRVCMPSKSILIVDDDRNLRQSMALVLRRGDYHVDTAGSASEALAFLDTGQYDLTIVDMMMPDDGSIFLPRLLATYPCLPILILTPQISPETPLEA